MRTLLLLSRYLPYRQGERMTLCTLPRTLAIVAAFIAVAWAGRA
jgi:hypothetical protein